MRTTLNLPDALVEEVKVRAAAEGRTFTSLVEEGLRALLDRHASTRPAQRLPAYGDPDARLLIDITDRDALWAVLDEDGFR